MFSDSDYLKRWKKCEIVLEGVNFPESEIVEVGDNYIVFTTPRNRTIVALCHQIKFIVFEEERKSTWWQLFQRERELKKLFGEEW